MARSPLPALSRRLIDVEVAGAIRRGTPTAALIPADGAQGSRYGAGQRVTGKAGEVLTVAGPDGGTRWLAGIGAGTPAQYRGAGAALVRAINEYLAAEVEVGARPASTVQVELPDTAGTAEVAELALGVLLGGYQYAVTAEDPKPSIRNLRLVSGYERAVPAFAGAVERAGELAAATTLARDLANAPSNIKDPAWLAQAAEQAAGKVPGLKVTVYDEHWLAEQRFGGVLAVGGGSVRPPRLIELSYRPRGAGTHLLLVGKGITFDTGGISIKPADGMHLMRTDMAGGAAVIAAVRGIAALRLPVRVTALVPAAENHVSGSAYRPGDVVRHYGGKTTEVGNTDAEGRMVLADALQYGIERFHPDVVVDVATLTGAMKVALGLRTGGVFATEDALAERVVEAGRRTGEAWWRMPLLDAHTEGVRGTLADVRQAPSGPGAVMAALFLREFTEGLPWAHLDIAGPARADRVYDEVTPGGTGFAARTLIELAAGYAGESD